MFASDRFGTSSQAPAWLTARPIAHRGLHDGAHGIVENSLAAARAAIAGNYAIECDVQPSKDGEAIVFHDAALARLTGVAGDVGALEAKALTAIAYRDSTERIATLAELLHIVAGRVPLIVEVKSRFDGDRHLASRIAELAASYSGPLAVKSFDPHMLAALRAQGLACPVGLVAQAHYAAEDWPELDAEARRNLAAFAQFGKVRPDFLSWCFADLPHAGPSLCRAFGLPVMVWTVRSEPERCRALAFADQIVFEGFKA